MTPSERLARSRAFAEQARHLKPKHLIDDLLVFGQVAEGEYFTARCIVATAPVEVCDLGLVHVGWSRLQDALAMSLSGWAVVRVAFGKRLVGPKDGDVALAQQRLRALGIDGTLPLYVQEPATW